MHHPRLGAQVAPLHQFSHEHLRCIRRDVDVEQLASVHIYGRDRADKVWNSAVDPVGSVHETLAVVLEQSARGKGPPDEDVRISVVVPQPGSASSPGRWRTSPRYA